MMSVVTALFLVPAAVAFAAVVGMAKWTKDRIPRPAYLLSITVPIFGVWLTSGVLAYRAVTYCAPACDGMTPGMIVIFGVLASVATGLGGFVRCFVAIEWLNRRI